MSVTRHLRWLLLAVPMALAACEEMPATATPAAAAAVGPGTGKVDGVMASIMFGQICADTYPSIEKARAEVVKLPFVQHPQTGTYYHKSLDLSFKLTNTAGLKACSMVMGSDQEANPLAIILGGLVQGSGSSATGKIDLDPVGGRAQMKLTHNGEFLFQPTSRTGNRIYYNAIMKRQ